MSIKDIHKELSNHILVDHFDMIYDIEKSYGNYLYDSKYDRYLLDCFSFIASNPLGHNHPGLNDPEFEKKLLKVAKTNPSNSDIICKEFAEFVETFRRVAMPPEFKKAFFISGGTLAVENAIKTAFDWKIRKLHSQDKLGIKAEDLVVVHFNKCFHGRSGYCLSLTSTSPEKYKYFPKFDWPRFEASLEGEKQITSEMKLAELRLYFARNPDKVACITTEAIGGEGGDRHFSQEFHNELKKLSIQNDCLLIYDEVQTGLGLTGKMWAYQHYNIIPDIVCFGKKTQVCGIMVGDRVLSVKGNVFEEPSRINSTWGGHLVDMVRCQRYLEIIEQDRLEDNAQMVGVYLLKNLKRLEKKYKNLITNVRGKGLMCAFDLPCSGARNLFVKLMLENGVLVLGCGDKSIRFRPSLTFTKHDVDTLVAKLKLSLKDH